MGTHLTDDQIEAFHQNGYHTPHRVFTEKETTDFRLKLEALDTLVGDKAVSMRTDMHLIQKWAWDVVHDPRIVDPVSDVLGPDVLLWSLNWFIKEPRDGKFVTYHQDATYWGLEPHNVVTAWVALSDASSSTGPMKFIPGSHRDEVYEHLDTFGEDNLLSRGQVIQTDIDEADAVASPLQPGEMSLHHVRLIHGSEPNQTDDRRIGMVLRYCATNVRQTKLRDTAVLVKGRDDFHHFDLLSGPLRDMGEKEISRQKDALRRMHRALHSMDYE